MVHDKATTHSPCGGLLVCSCLQVEKIYVVKMGEIVLTGPDGSVVSNPAFVKEAGGFTFFGDSCLEAITRCPYTVSFLGLQGRYLLLLGKAGWSQLPVVKLAKMPGSSAVQLALATCGGLSCVGVCVCHLPMPCCAVL